MNKSLLKPTIACYLQSRVLIILKQIGTKHFVLSMLLFCLLSCGKHNDPTPTADPVIDQPILTGQNVFGHEFSFDSQISVSHGKSKDFDVDQDGVNDVRITETLVVPSLPANQQPAYNTFQFQQQFDVTILNPKLSLAIVSPKTSFTYETGINNNTSTKVIDRPALININPATTKVDGKLNYSSQTDNSLLYIGQFIYAQSRVTLLVPKWPQDPLNNNFTYPDIYAPDLASGLSNLEPFNTGYIGFKLMDANNQPKYGWISVDTFNDQWIAGNLSFERWYQVSLNIYQRGVGNKPNIPIQPGCLNYDGCSF